jgi:L-asparagine transporter-like permease
MENCIGTAILTVCGGSRTELWLAVALVASMAAFIVWGCYLIVFGIMQGSR